VGEPGAIRRIDGVPESQIFREYRASGNRRLRNQLIEAHRPLAVHLARRFANRTEPLDDLVQVAQVGLLKAVERFDPEQYKLNEAAIAAYQDQLRRLTHQTDVPLAAILALPGVVLEPQASETDDQTTELVQQALGAALGELQQMRAREGASMLDNLNANLSSFRGLLDEVEKLAPRVVENFSQRIRERIQNLLAKYEIATQPADVIREIGLFAERADIRSLKLKYVLKNGFISE
jgi:uncharacterized protein (TIGR00255 family)